MMIKQIVMPQPEVTKNATIMPLNERVRVIVGSEEEIFGEKYIQAYNSMNRVVKYKKEAVHFQ